jgi:hypothetical protein
MTVGLRIRDGSTGAVTVEITDRLTRLIGNVRITSAPGSFNVPGENIPFFYLTSDGLGTRIPPVNISGRTIYWSQLGAEYPNPNSVDFWIAYGEY